MDDWILSGRPVLAAALLFSAAVFLIIGYISGYRPLTWIMARVADGISKLIDKLLGGS